MKSPSINLGTLMVSLSILLVGSNALQCYQCYWTDYGDGVIPMPDLNITDDLVLKFDASCQKGSEPGAPLITTCSDLSQEPEPACSLVAATVKLNVGRPQTINFHIRGCSMIFPQPGFGEGCATITLQDILDTIPNSPEKDEMIRQIDASGVDRSSSGDVCNCKGDNCNGKDIGEDNGKDNDDGESSMMKASYIIIFALAMFSFKICA